jgi:glycerol uptake facilitator-like aquaporin
VWGLIMMTKPNYKRLYEYYYGEYCNLRKENISLAFENSRLKYSWHWHDFFLGIVLTFAIMFSAMCITLQYKKEIFQSFAIEHKLAHWEINQQTGKTEFILDEIKK